MKKWQKYSPLSPFLSNFSYFVLCRTYLQHQKKVFGRFLSVATLRMEYSKKNLLLVAIVKGFRVKDLPTQCKKVSKTFGDFLASPYKISRGTFYILISVYCQSTNFLAEHLIGKQVIVQNFRAKFCTQMRQTLAALSLDLEPRHGLKVSFF